MHKKFKFVIVTKNTKENLWSWNSSNISHIRYVPVEMVTLCKVNIVYISYKRPVNEDYLIPRLIEAIWGEREWIKLVFWVSKEVCALNGNLVIFGFLPYHSVWRLITDSGRVRESKQYLIGYIKTGRRRAPVLMEDARKATYKIIFKNSVMPKSLEAKLRCASNRLSMAFQWISLIDSDGFYGPVSLVF